MMQLFYSPGACSLASHIALREAGLPFEAVRVQGRSPKMAGGVEYASITEKNYVPALKLDDGTVLTEGTAILPYVADRNAAAKLAPPAGSMDRYRLHEWLGYLNSEVHKGFSPFFSPATTEEQKAAGRENLGRKFDFIQKQLGGKTWLLGESFSVADAYLFTVLGWNSLVGIDLARWPVLKAYHERAAARPAVQAAMKAEGLIK